MAGLGKPKFSSGRKTAKRVCWRLEGLTVILACASVFFAQEAVGQIANASSTLPILHFSSSHDALNIDNQVPSTLRLIDNGPGVLNRFDDPGGRLRIEGAYSSGDAGGGQTTSARARLFLLDRLTLESTFKQVYGSQTSGGSGDKAAEQKLELKLRVLGY